MVKRIKNIDINDIEREYAPNFDIFTEDSNEMTRLKDIVVNRLDEIDKRIMLLYVEYESQRKVARILGVSPSTINNRIREIREKIKEYL